MTSIQPFDVVIIGAGPAGLAAGIVCARNGLLTLVCDKRHLPADKACAEGLLPTGLESLDRLGAKAHLQAGNFFPFSGIRYHSPQGRTAAGAFREGAGWGIPRLHLSQALLQEAARLDLLHVQPGQRAVSFARLEDRVVVDFGQGRAAARLMIGADGLNSGVRRWAGLDGPPARRLRWGVRQHFAIRPWSEYVEIYWGQGVEAYLTPCGPELISLAFLWDRDRFPAVPGGDRLIDFFLSHFPELNSRLEGAGRCDLPRAVGPLQRSARSRIAEGVLLIGDAAGYLDAITGEGISLALAQALALEETVIPLLGAGATRPGLLPPRRLENFARAQRAILRPNLQITRLVLLLSRRPALVELAVRLLDRQPRVFQVLLSANMGRVSLPSFFPA